GSERSVYVDYKSVDPKADFVQEWGQRIADVYGSWSKNTVGFKFYSTADNYYHSLSNQDLAYLHSKGVSHALFKQKKTNENLKLIYQDKKNFVYALNY
ncbi:MAG: hypothetical protein KJP21_00095, partial [Bacteroidia bacterium]|nr:hypothetical protein [Bacteroidia bacterium]NNJ54675.1 hypothetical protein [Bacteroidia bacterium]